METVLINNEKIRRKKESSSDKSILQLVENISETYLQTNEIITNVIIDGESYDATIDNPIFHNSIKTISTIDFTVKSNEVLTHEAVKSCEQTLVNVLAKIQEISDQYKKNEAGKANATFVEIIEVTDLFIQLIGLIHQSLKRSKKGKYQKSNKIHELEIHLLATLKALLPAKEKDDIIMLCDLLEYELADNLNRWKKEIIPELKSLSQA